MWGKVRKINYDECCFSILILLLSSTINFKIRIFLIITKKLFFTLNFLYHFPRVNLLKFAYFCSTEKSLFSHIGLTIQSQNFPALFRKNIDQKICWMPKITKFFTAECFAVFVITLHIKILGGSGWLFWWTVKYIFLVFNLL